jgi:DNA-binding response OmpR family regulator
LANQNVISLQGIFLRRARLLQNVCLHQLFAFFIDASRALRQLSGLPPGWVHAMSGRRILLVDDDQQLRDVAATALRMLGLHEVLACESGIRAIASAAAFRPDLMLLDVSMPGLDGPQTLTALRRQAHLVDVPAVFLTTRTQAKDVSHYKSLGARDVIAKPFDPQHLVNRIEAVLDFSERPPTVMPARRSALVVEDDPGIRFLLGFLLEQQGLDMRAAEDGNVGLRVVQNEAPADLVILDVMMPGIDGLGLLERMKALAPWRDVPVMMMTTRNDEKSMTRALALGANDYVVKPFEPAELMQRLLRLLPGEEAGAIDSNPASGASTA